jgi:SMODS-associating 4TM effector domain
MEEAVRRSDDEAVSDGSVTNAFAPRGVPARAIHERQLDEDMLRIQRAAAASHQQGQRIEALRVSVAVALAIAGIIVTLTGHGRPAWSIIGALWFGISAFMLKSAAERTAHQGALLQEMFDTTLFYLPWRSTVAGDPVPEPEVARLARKLPRRGAKEERILSGWYDPTGGIHHPYDILVAQEQNLSWDGRLRRRYGHCVLAAAIVWSLIGLAAGMVIANATVTDTLLSFFVPSLAGYQIALEIWSGQQKVATERDRLAKIVGTELRQARRGPISDDDWCRLRELTRNVQDGVLSTRFDVSRVPEWFYKRYRNNDELDFADTAEGHRRRLADDGTH